MTGMMSLPSMSHLMKAPLSQAVSELLDGACGAIDTDLAVVRWYVERAAVLIERRQTETAVPDRPAVPPAAGGLAPWQMMRVTRFVDANLEGNVTNGELAEQVRLSRSYFAKAFRRSFGQSPHSYVLARRIERAKKLMLESCDPISHVALACGFSDQAHLARIFHRLVGQTPNQWRRAHRAVAAVACSDADYSPAAMLSATASATLMPSTAADRMPPA